MMNKNVDMKEYGNISLRVRGFILKNPGLTKNEIIRKLQEEPRGDLGFDDIHLMSHSGMIIVRNNKYYAPGNSVIAKAKRYRKRQKEIWVHHLIPHEV